MRKKNVARRSETVSLR